MYAIKLRGQTLSIWKTKRDANEEARKYRAWDWTRADLYKVVRVRSTASEGR